MIELARWFAGQPKQKRGILFMTFAGEELGLLGSSFYVNHPELPLDKAVAMINMDMIGRVRDGKVYIGGVGTGTHSAGDARPDSAAAITLNVDYLRHHRLRIERSHLVHHQAGAGAVLLLRPALATITSRATPGTRSTRPDAAKLLELIADVGDHAARGSRAAAVRAREGAGITARQGAWLRVRPQSGYGPYFGSIPDFAEIPQRRALRRCARGLAGRQGGPARPATF